MISKFFIEHPVLANVLAIVIVLLGLVSLLRLPIAQYPNVTPPTVQVMTRYPGASPQTVINTVALPIELQVNGVPGMIYMEFDERLRRHLCPDHQFRDRQRPEYGPGPGPKPGAKRDGAAARIGTGAGGLDPRQIGLDPRICHLAFAGQLARCALFVELRDNQPDQRAGAVARGRQRYHHGRRPIFDADLDGSEQALFVWSGPVRCQPGHPAAEPGGRRGAGRDAARPDPIRRSNIPST